MFVENDKHRWSSGFLRRPLSNVNTNRNFCVLLRIYERSNEINKNFFISSYLNFECPFGTLWWLGGLFRIWWWFDGICLKVLGSKVYRAQSSTPALLVTCAFHASIETLLSVSFQSLSVSISSANNVGTLWSYEKRRSISSKNDDM